MTNWRGWLRNELASMYRWLGAHYMGNYELAQKVMRDCDPELGRLHMQQLEIQCAIRDRLKELLADNPKSD